MENIDKLWVDLIGMKLWNLIIFSVQRKSAYLTELVKIGNKGQKSNFAISVLEALENWVIVSLEVKLRIIEQTGWFS